MSKASDAVRTTAQVFGGLTGALFLFTDGASFRLAPEALIGHLAAWGIDGLSVVLVKKEVGRARPYTYSPRYPGAYSPEEIADSSASFYSGHTSQTAVTLFSAATTFTLYHKRGLRWRILCPVMYAVALGGTMTVGELRVRAGKHFYSDVITGGMVGALFGIGIPVASYYIGKTIREKWRAERRKVGFSIQPTTAGLQVQGWF
jgi:membrane-associated phospholipid phosphatase